VPETAARVIWVGWVVSWLAAAAWSGETVRRPDGAAWPFVAVTGGGVVLAWWARVHIGRLWSSTITRKAEHHVVDTGPYALVRRPIYSGLTLSAVATALLMGTPTACAGGAVMALGWYVKARLEARFLREQLGAAYEAYARRVPMLVPFLPR
jgi:protein-S-isoprenylcysteine O-methyltransferase Ste14